MENKLVRLDDVLTAIESMKLVSVSGLKFDFADQHNQTLRDAQGLMSTLATVEIPRWIPVTEKFPKVDIPVIGFDAFSESVLECCYSGNNWYLMDEHETELSNVTHWMELPKHPTE